ncbi:hypothetical protein T10_3908 [Trichinella papuae]|uniref:Uncharacterized protein n=1 Tax=Trichinella papuae TaxID=268474 RepID=A0A0V1M4J5_9BILA|nr:hypothetical protein T10_3908 [Trichinella papuae]
MIVNSYKLRVQSPQFVPSWGEQFSKIVDFLPCQKIFFMISYVRSFMFGELCSISHNGGLSNDDLKQLAEHCTYNNLSLVDSKEDIPFSSSTISRIP